jgi:hypothetical protein
MQECRTKLSSRGMQPLSARLRGGPFHRSPKTLPAFYGGCLGWAEDPDGCTRDGTLEGGTVEAVMQRQGVRSFASGALYSN